MTVDANFRAITATFLDIDQAIAEEKFDAALEMIPSTQGTSPH